MKTSFRLTTTARLTIVILISRLLGYVRDMFVAAFIGACPTGDALMAAFKLTNLFRAIFSEGAMSSAVVPAISKSFVTHGQRYTAVLASHVFSSLMFVLCIFVSFIMYFMEEFIVLTNPGFTSRPDVLSLAKELSYITFPYLIFISGAAFYGSVLQSRKAFLPYASTSIILNLTIIASLSLGTYLLGASPVHSFAYGLITSGVLEFSWMLFFGKVYNVRIVLRKPMRSIYIYSIIKRILPGIFGSGLNQISVWCDMIILSFFTGGISFLYFADRIIQLPLAIFSTANAIVLLPSLSKNYNNQEVRFNIFNRSFRKTLSLIIPSSVGIFLTGDVIVEALFMHGQFDAEAAEHTTMILRLLALALPFQALSKIYNAVLYASGDTSNPVKFSAISLAVNVSFSFLLMEEFGYLCVAIATIMSSATQLCLLAYYCMDRKQDGSLSTATKKDIYKYLFGSLLMGIGIFTIRYFFETISSCKSMMLCVGLGGIIYSITLMICKAKACEDFLTQPVKQL